MLLAKCPARQAAALVAVDLLVVGLLANLAVRPVAEKYHEPEDRDEHERSQA